MQDDDNWKRGVDSSLARLNTEVSELKSTLGDMKKDGADLLEAFDAARGAFKVLGFFGKLAQPLAWIGGVWFVGQATFSKLRAAWPWLDQMLK